MATVTALGMLLSSPANAVNFQLGFEGLPGGTPVGATYAGLGITFSGANFATAGIDLNEIDFPPKSGVNVLLADTGGTISASMTAPAYAIGAFFTYSMDPGEFLTLTAYSTPDLSGLPVGLVQSKFSENFVGNGNALATPNEFMGIFVGAPEIRSFKIEGPAFAGGFTMDNLIAFNAIPEPSVVWGGALLVGFVIIRRLRTRGRTPLGSLIAALAGIALAVGVTGEAHAQEGGVLSISNPGPFKCGEATWVDFLLDLRSDPLVGRIIDGASSPQLVMVQDGVRAVVGKFLDDGDHDDGAAGDNVFGLEYPVGGSSSPSNFIASTAYRGIAQRRESTMVVVPACPQPGGRLTISDPGPFNCGQDYEVVLTLDLNVDPLVARVKNDANSPNLISESEQGVRTVVGKLWDDGLHGDGAAGDKVFGVLVSFRLEPGDRQITYFAATAYRARAARVFSNAVLVDSSESNCDPCFGKSGQEASECECQQSGGEYVWESGACCGPGDGPCCGLTGHSLEQCSCEQAGYGRDECVCMIDFDGTWINGECCLPGGDLCCGSTDPECHASPYLTVTPDRIRTSAPDQIDEQNIHFRLDLRGDPDLASVKNDATSPRIIGAYGGPKLWDNGQNGDVTAGDNVYESDWLTVIAHGDCEYNYHAQISYTGTSTTKVSNTITVVGDQCCVDAEDECCINPNDICCGLVGSDLTACNCRKVGKNWVNGVCCNVSDQCCGLIGDELTLCQCQGSNDSCCGLEGEELSICQCNIEGKTWLNGSCCSLSDECCVNPGSVACLFPQCNELSGDEYQCCIFGIAYEDGMCFYNYDDLGVYKCERDCPERTFCSWNNGQCVQEPWGDDHTDPGSRGN